METPKAPPTWLLVLQFIAAVVVMALLIAGPGSWGSAGQRIRQYLHRPAAPATGGLAPGRPAATGVPSGGAPIGAAPLRPTPGPAVIPVSQPASPGIKPVPVVTPAFRATPGLRVSPSPRGTASPRAETRQAAPTPQASPTAAQATPAPMRPQQYFAKLMRDGYRLYQTGWYGPAMARFKEAARVSPNSASVQLWYGRSAMRAGRPAEARAALERVIALAPSSDAAREARGLIDRIFPRSE